MTLTEQEKELIDNNLARKEERRMKSLSISGVVIGTIIGMALAYFSPSSVNGGNLAGGALLGGLAGLCLGILAAVPAGPVSGRNSDMDGMGTRDRMDVMGAFE